MRIQWGATAIGVLLVCGTVGAHWIFKVNFLVAFYWTLALMTTVGGTTVHPVTTGQIAYASAILIVGTGLWIFWLSVVVAAVVNFNQTRKERRLMQQIRRLEGHFVILGAGRVGVSVARELTESGTSVVIADTDATRIAAIGRDDWVTLALPSYETEHLRSLHLERAGGAAVALPEDAQTLFAYLSVREVNPQLPVAARARTPETANRLLQLGVDEVVLPDHIGGHRIARWLIKPRAHRIMAALLNEDGVGVHEVEVGPGHVMLRQPVRQVRQVFGDAYTLLAYWRAGRPHMAPPADDIIESGDVLVLIEQREVTGG